MRLVWVGFVDRYHLLDNSIAELVSLYLLLYLLPFLPQVIHKRIWYGLNQVAHSVARTASMPNIALDIMPALSKAEFPLESFEEVVSVLWGLPDDTKLGIGNVSDAEIEDVGTVVVGLS